MPNTATLSVMRTFMSVPSRDLIDNMDPSTASMVPRIRTVGGCCAHAAVPSRATKAIEAASRREFVSMCPSQDRFRQDGVQSIANTGREYLFHRLAYSSFRDAK